MNEIVWKKFRKTKYSVSDNGLIRNNITNKLLTGGIDTAGYRFVKLNNHQYNVHVLVGIVFLGFVPDGRNNVIHHKDGDKLNAHKAYQEALKGIEDMNVE